MNFKFFCSFGIILLLISLRLVECRHHHHHKPWRPKYLVSIQLYPDDASKLGLDHHCDGTVISPRRIITAAHCVFRPKGGRYLPFELIVVLVGLPNVHSPRTLDIAYIKSHGAFRRDETLFGDIAYLVLRNEIPSDDPDTEDEEMASSPPKEKEVCSLLSWKNSAAKVIQVVVHDETFCKELYGSMFVNGMICASPQRSDSCPTDSGGPLVCHHQVVGVLSWGMEEKCGPHTTAVFTDVTRFKKWLSKGARLDANYFVVFFVTTIVLKSSKFINV